MQGSNGAVTWNYHEIVVSVMHNSQFLHCVCVCGGGCNVVVEKDVEWLY